MNFAKNLRESEEVSFPSQDASEKTGQQTLSSEPSVTQRSSAPMSDLQELTDKKVCFFLSLKLLSGY